MEYRQHILETRDINIIISNVPLQTAERIIAARHTESVFSFKVGDTTHIINLGVRHKKKHRKNNTI